MDFSLPPALVAALDAALEGVSRKDLAARAAGAKINWPTSWEQALAPDTLSPLVRELGEPVMASPAVNG